MDIQEARVMIKDMYGHDHSFDKCTIYEGSLLDQAIKLLLEQPILPKEPTDELLWCLTHPQNRTSCMNRNSIVAIRTTERYNALYNHLITPPKSKTKKIKVWRVEYFRGSNPGCTVRNSLDAANILVSELNKYGGSRCINIIEGEQEVPA